MVMPMLVNDGRDFFERLLQLIQNQKLDPTPLVHEGGPVEEIRPGDVVWFPPGEKHWHGAMPTTAMTHLAIQEKLDGKAANWMKQVSDEQSRA